MNQLELDALLAGRDKAALKVELELVRQALADNERVRKRLEARGKRLIEALADIRGASV